MSSATKLPKTWFRLSMFFLGILVLGWLPIEDVDLRVAFIFAGAFCTVIAVNFLLETSNIRADPFRVPLIGTLTGLAVCPVVILLMTFKSGVHGHGSPDITFSEILSILRLTPLFGGSGLIISAGVRLWILSKATP